jgi:COMM domain containing 9
MQVPNVIVALNLEDQAESVLELPAVRTVQFELNRESLATVIDGLGKIRDQLSKMG